MIIPWNELQSAKVQVHHPECNGVDRFYMRCEYDNQDCFIQVPLSTIYQCDKKMSVGFPYFAEHRDKLRFVKKMEELDKWFCDQFTKLWKTMNPSKKRKKVSIRWTPFIRRHHHTAYMSFSIQMEKTRNVQGKIILTPILDVYDRQKNRIGGVESLETMAYAYHIIHMDYIWVSYDTDATCWTAGMQWSVVQTRIYPSIFRLSENECIIREEPNDFPDTTEHIKPISPVNLLSEEHPIYGKYIKMRRMGIPDGAIEIKLKQEGRTMQDFENWSKTGLSAPPKNDAPPMSALFSAIKAGGFSLKKAEKKEIVPIQIKDKFTPPSKDDLLNILQKLKKVN